MAPYRTPPHNSRNQPYRTSLQSRRARESTLPSRSRGAQQYRQNPARPFAQKYRNRRGSKFVTTGLLTVAFAVTIGLIGLISLQSLGINPPGADANSQNLGAQSTSIPKDEWKQGVTPLLFQTDPAWADIRYAENNFGESGCGPTCMAMVYACLKGSTDKDPAAMAAFATENGYASEDGTSWAFMTDGAKALGLSVEELPADESSIRRSVVAGKPVICSVGPGDFTSLGHFIVLTDIDQNGNLAVHDPNSAERSAKTWSFETIISQSRNIWSYSLV